MTSIHLRTWPLRPQGNRPGERVVSGAMRPLLCLLVTVAACRAPAPPVARAGATAQVDPLGRGAWFVDDENDGVLFTGPHGPVVEHACRWPVQLLVSTSGDVYAACRGEGAVRRLSDPTAEWRVGPEPSSLALDERAGRLYVGLATSHEVVMLDASNGLPLGRAFTQAEPTALALFESELVVGSRKSAEL